MKKKIFVLDANVILHDSNAIFSFAEHDICIPLEAIEEIDHKKKGDDVVNYNSREFARIIDKFSPTLLYDGGASLGKNLGKIRIVITPVYQEEVAALFSETSNDNKIINAAFTLSNENKDASVILVSKDIIMRIKARALKIEAESYKTDAVIDLNSLYKKARKIQLNEPDIETLYQQGFVETSEDLIDNEFVLIETNRGLGMHRDGQIIPVFKEKINVFNVKPKNDEQAFALSALLDPEIKLVVIIGKAGTGKTMLALAAGLYQIQTQNNLYSSVLFTRKTMDLNDRPMGFLPGDVKDKMFPYLQCMYDNLEAIKSIEKANEGKISKLSNNDKIIIEPLPYIKGRSLVNKYFIIDEAQNLTPKEVKAIVTRAGEGTKVVLIGDTSQIDTSLLDERSNGLSVTFDKMKGQPFFSGLYLRESVRSDMAKIAGDLL